jgi:hypothetical protein
MHFLPFLGQTSEFEAVSHCSYDLFLAYFLGEALGGSLVDGGRNSGHCRNTVDCFAPAISGFADGLSWAQRRNTYLQRNTMRL